MQRANSAPVRYSDLTVRHLRSVALVALVTLWPYAPQQNVASTDRATDFREMLAKR